MASASYGEVEDARATRVRVAPVRVTPARAKAGRRRAGRAPSRAAAIRRGIAATVLIASGYAATLVALHMWLAPG